MQTSMELWLPTVSLLIPSARSSAQDSSFGELSRIPLIDFAPAPRPLRHCFSLTRMRRLLTYDGYSLISTAEMLVGVRRCGSSSPRSAAFTRHGAD